MSKFSSHAPWNVTRSITIVSLFYFLYYGGCAWLFPFLTLYFRKLGLSATQAGIICASKYLVWNFSGPLWLRLAQRVQKTRIVLAIALLVAIVANFSITFIHPVNKEVFLNQCNLDFHNVSVNGTEVSVATSFDQTGYPKQLENGSSFATIGFSSDITTAGPALVPLTKKTESKKSFSTSSLKTSGSATTSPKTTTPAKLAETTISLKSIKYSYEKLTPYQMAAHLLPRVTKSGAKTYYEISRLVSQYKETKHWPRWKRRTVVQKIIKLLKQNVFDQPFKSNNPFTTTERRGVGDSASLFEDSLAIDDPQAIIDMYLRARSRHPSLTPRQFLESSDAFYTLSMRVQSALEDMLNTAVEDLSEKFRRKKRSTPDFNISFGFFDDVEETVEVEENVTQNEFDYMTFVSSYLTKNPYLFVMILAIVCAGELMSAPIDLLSDHSIYELLDELDCLNRYGSHKTWALLSTMLASLSVSASMYYLPCVVLGTVTKYEVNFFGFVILAGLALLVVPFFPYYEQRNNRQTYNLTTAACPACSLRLCMDCRRFLLFATLYIVGMLQSLEFNFLFWHVETLPGASYTIFGFIAAANALCALISTIIGRWFKSKLHAVVTIPVCMLVVATKLILYSFLGQSWFFVPAQLLNIFGSSMIWAVVYAETNMMTSWQDEPDLLNEVRQVQVLAKTSRSRSIQVAYVCVYQGLGYSIGSLLAGIAFDLSGESLLPVVRVAAAVSCAWAIIYFVSHRCCVRVSRERKYLTLLGESDDEYDVYEMDPKVKASILKDYRKRSSSKYLEKTKKMAQSRMKRRNKKVEVEPTSEDDLERDWKAMSSRRDAKVL